MNGNNVLQPDLDPEQQLPAEERAFRESDEHEFAGKKLEPFSFVRQTAAIELGLKYWRLRPEDLRSLPNPRKALLADGTVLTDEQRAKIETEPADVQMYDGLVRDTAIVLWLCSQPDSICRRARRKPDEYDAQIDQFADEHGICLGSDTLAEATTIFVQIVAEINTSRAKPHFAEGESKVSKTPPKI